MKKLNLVSQSQAARELHKNRGTLRDWLAKGAPHHNGMVDVDELRQWRAQRPTGPIAPHLRKVQRETMPDQVAEKTRKELDAVLAGVDTGEGIDAAVQRLRQTERIAFRLLRDVQGRADTTGEQIRARLHTDAVQGLVKVESLIDERQQIRAEEQGLMLQALTDWWAPVKALLDQMPRALSSRCNPSDAPTAEAALRDWLLTQLYPTASRQPQPKEKP
jgi:hypothetical protein